MLNFAFAGAALAAFPSYNEFIAQKQQEHESGPWAAAEKFSKPSPLEYQKAKKKQANNALALAVHASDEKKAAAAVADGADDIDGALREMRYAEPNYNIIKLLLAKKVSKYEFGGKILANAPNKYEG
jgi:hypothetical protein